MRRALLIFGAALVAAGVFWALQGAGVVMWPAGSFMLERTHWIGYGGITALIGMALMGAARRIR